MFKRDESHSVDLLFTLGLFCVFAASAFILVIIGIRVYQGTVDQMQDTFSTRTAIAYVAEKLRRHDEAGAVELTQIDGLTALRMTDSVGEDTYCTYVYSDGEYLWELTIRDGVRVSASMGEKIIQVKDFQISGAGGGFYEFTASDSAGGTVRFLIHLRSESA